MNKLYTTLLTIAAIGMLAPAVSAACKQESPELTLTDTPLGTLYVDNDPCQPDCVISLWVYQESNGIPDLQRGDEVETSCDAGEEADTILL